MLEEAQVENAVVVGWFLISIAEVLGSSKQIVHKKHAKRIKIQYPVASLLICVRRHTPSFERLPACYKLALSSCF